ncbi:MAG: CYTH domain-containing protein [Bacteroidota bacterium]|nr:CYTH domain-containing protein [Bacteroidota bacterium]
MALEIERKFLVRGEFKSFASESQKISQGYLSSVVERTVRVRIKGEQGFITIKGKGNETGVSRYEFEKEITLQEAQELLNICEPGVIDKRRFIVKVGKHNFEVDEFYGENKGLIIAEIELESEAEEFVKPQWLGKEVTGDARYYNAMLSKNPYCNWK